MTIRKEEVRSALAQISARSLKTGVMMIYVFRHIFHRKSVAKSLLSISAQLSLLGCYECNICQLATINGAIIIN